MIAVPVALATAIFISEYAPPGCAGRCIALVDLMAAVPSIVYGLWGVFFLQPRIIGTVRWLSEHLAFIPIFEVRGAAHAELVHRRRRSSPAWSCR